MLDWLFGKRLEVLPDFQDLLQAAGLDDYERLMFEEVGDRISLESENEVRRIAVPSPQGERTFFLKRTWEKIPLSWALKKWVRFRSQHSRAYLELNAVRELAEKGYAVMTPAAWGERITAGIPAEGFLLTEQVLGRPADEIWREADAKLRRRMLRDFGSLLGRLHRDGFFAFVRFKDLFCPEIPDDPGVPIEWVQIDRACSKEGARRATPTRCYLALAESYVCVLREDEEPSLRELAIFARSYLTASHGYPPGGIRELFRGVHSATERKFPNEIVGARFFAGATSED